MEGFFEYVTGTVTPREQKQYISREQIRTLVEEAILWRKTEIGFDHPLTSLDEHILKEEGFTVSCNNLRWSRSQYTMKWPQTNPGHYPEITSFEQLCDLLETRIPTLPRRYEFVQKFYPEFMKDYEKLLTLDYIAEHDPELDKLEHLWIRCVHYCENYPTVSHLYAKMVPLVLLVQAETPFIYDKWTYEQIKAVYSRVPNDDPMLLEVIKEIGNGGLTDTDVSTMAMRYFYNKLAPELKGRMLADVGRYERAVRLAVKLNLVDLTESTVITLMKNGVYGKNIFKQCETLDLDLEDQGTTIAQSLLDYLHFRRSCLTPHEAVRTLKLLLRADFEAIRERLDVRYAVEFKYRMTSWHGLPVQLVDIEYDDFGIDRSYSYEVHMLGLFVVVREDRLYPDDDQ